jgi:rhodanese-related sulfurtransferase
MSTLKKLAVILMIATLALVACDAGESREAIGDAARVQNKDSYTDITVSQLESMMAAKDFTLVNVHIPYEGEIPQTDLFVPFDQIGDSLHLLPEKGAPIVLYCRSGNMSTTAAKELAALGYSDIMELDGGFNAWAADGHELLHQP